MFYSKLLLQRSVMYTVTRTRCIDSNLESLSGTRSLPLAVSPGLPVRYTSRVVGIENRRHRHGSFLYRCFRSGAPVTEAYQTVHLKEFTDFPKEDEKDPTEVFTDIHFEKKSVAHEAYHSSHWHGFY